MNLVGDGNTLPNYLHMNYAYCCQAQLDVSHVIKGLYAVVNSNIGCCFTKCDLYYEKLPPATGK